MAKEYKGRRRPDTAPVALAAAETGNRPPPVTPFSLRASTSATLSLPYCARSGRPESVPSPSLLSGRSVILNFILKKPAATKKAAAYTGHPPSFGKLPPPSVRLYFTTLSAICQVFSSVFPNFFISSCFSILFSDYSHV